MGLMETVIDIPAEHEANVFGQFDAYAKKIERALHVTLIARGESVKIMGDALKVEKAKKVLDQLVELSKRGNTIQEQNVDYTLALVMEDSEENAIKSAESWAQTLHQEVFPDLRVGLVHGRMKSAEKDAALSAFRAGESDILVSTTVVEVGVDVPNATLMVIENAERFGLSQLHQLRGRVGRGQAQSYCVLVSSTKNEETKKRLQALCKTTDGFKIAEQDLALRGPGDFFGSRQHGLPLLKVASLQMDLETLRDAQQAAAAVIQTADSLNAPELAPLKARVEALFTRQEVSLN